MKHLICILTKKHHINNKRRSFCLYFFQLIVFCLLIVFNNSNGFCGKYAVNRIDSSLLENASAVIREHKTVYDIRSLRRASKTHKRAITILKPDARELGNLQLYYKSNRNRIRNLKGVIYDKHGNKIRTLSEDDFSDVSYILHFSVYQDSRVIKTDVHVRQTPYTIKYEYTKNTSGTFLSKLWLPVSYANTSLEKSVYVIKAPETLSFRYKSNNSDELEPVISDYGRRGMKYKWELSNQKAVKPEPYMPAWHEVLPFVQFADNEIVYEGYHGSLETWEDFGRFIAELNAGRQDLSDSTIEHIKTITEGVDDIYEKISIIYDYMQSVTRYVSIQIGIGGIQTDRASSVERNGYGDCKALSNFLQALLDVVGIKSYYTLIRSEGITWDFDPDFSFDYFNHAILCVPLEEDTLWVETTNGLLPAGYIGSTNSNRNALLVSENGGKLVRTPGYNQDRNVISQNISAQINKNGNVEVDIEKTFNELAIERRLAWIGLSSSEQKQKLSDEIKFSRVNVNELTYEINDRIPFSITKKASCEFENYISSAAGRLLFNPLFRHDGFSVPSRTDERIFPLQINSFLVYDDSIEWKLPANFSLSEVPESIEIDECFGYYRLDYQYIEDENILRVNRKMFFRNGQYEAEKYNNFVKFLQQIVSNERKRIMLRPV